MVPLNYSRQFVHSYDTLIVPGKGGEMIRRLIQKYGTKNPYALLVHAEPEGEYAETDQQRKHWYSLLFLYLARCTIPHAQKFILPEAGRFFDDAHSDTAIVDSGVPFRTPFKIAALEYWTPEVRLNKTIILTTEIPAELDGELEDLYMLTLTSGPHAQGYWAPSPLVSVHHENFRRVPDPKSPGKMTLEMRPRLRVPEHAKGLYTIDEGSEVVYEMGCFVSFVNALACRNVEVERQPNPQRLRKPREGVLPFDDYHVLTIPLRTHDAVSHSLGGTHRSPREHVRRGHIRRLPVGQIWVNQTIVNRGVGGKVIKDYAIL